LNSSKDHDSEEKEEFLLMSPIVVFYLSGFCPPGNSEVIHFWGRNTHNTEFNTFPMMVIMVGKWVCSLTWNMDCGGRQWNYLQYI